MEKLKYFLDCYFHQNETFNNLDQVIDDFKKEPKESQLQFITELNDIIQKQIYSKVARVVKKYGQKTLDKEQTEQFITFLYNRLLDKPAKIRIQDFEKQYRVVFCPICT